MTKNLCSLSDSVEEEMEESKIGRRYSQQTLKMLATQPDCPVLNHCALHQLLLHTFHHTFSPESHSYPYIAHLTLLQFLPSPEAMHHIALTWIVTLLIIHVLLTFTPFTRCISKYMKGPLQIVQLLERNSHHQPE